MQTIRKHHDGVWFDCRPAASGIWYIHWSEGRRSRRQSTGAKDVAAAQAFLDEWLILRAEGGPAKTLTCAELYADKYGRQERPAAAWKHLGPVFGAKAPASVSHAAVQDYIADRRRAGAAASTVAYEIACLYAAWNAAVKRRVLSQADLPVVPPVPPQSPPRERWLTDAEVDRLLAAARTAPRVALFLSIALDAAARRTAICELRWSQVDFDAGVIHFLPEGRVQTRKRRASVPMSNRLRAVLQTAHAARANDWVLGSPQPINRALAAVAKAAGLDGVTPHVMRHTAATHMARRGVPLWIIAKILGNTLEQVEGTYAKFCPDFGRDAVEQIGGSWGRLQGA
jgi:integrase